MAGDITTIARPYARAVFELAKDTGQLDAWSDALGLLASIAGSDAMAQQIDNPSIPRGRIQDVVLDVAGDGLSAQGRNLVEILTENGRLAVLPEIARLFEEMKTAEQGLRQVHIRSAYAVSAAQQKELSEALQQRLGAQVELTVEKDPSLIGGVEIRAGDLVIDGSVRGKLQRLATELQI